MPKVNLNSRDNTYSITGLVELHEAKIDQFVLTTSDVLFNKVDVLTDLTVNGNLTVKNMTKIESEIVTIKDNLIQLNTGENEPGIKLNIAGIEIDRGTLPNYQIVFEESSKNFKVGEIGNLNTVALIENDPGDDGIVIWDNTSKLLKSTDTINVPIVFADTTDVSNSNNTSSVKILGGLAVKKNIVTDGTIYIKGLNYGNTINSDITSNDFLFNSIADTIFTSNGNFQINSILKVNNNTASTSSSIGSAVFSGGISISNNTDAVSINSGGSFTTAGGAAINKSLLIGNNLSVGNNATITGTLAISSNIASTSVLTGALKLNGGISISNTTDAVSLGNGGTFTTDGGVSIAKKLFVGGDTTYTGILNINNPTISSSNSAGAILLSGGFSISNSTDAVSILSGGTFTTAGGAAIAKKLFVGGDTSVSGRIIVSNTTASSSTGIGAIVSAGGIAISNTSDASSASVGGSLTSAGGGSFMKKFFINSGTSVGDNNNFDGATNVASLNVNGDITLFNGTKNTIAFRNVGTGAPTFTTRSNGTKIILNPSLSGVNVDYALGVGTTSMWYSVPSVSSNHRFYHGITNTITFGGSQAVFNYTAATTNASTGGIISSGGIAISNTTNAVSSTNGGTLTTNGGGAFAKDVYIGGDLYVEGELMYSAFEYPTVISSNLVNLTAVESSNTKLFIPLKDERELSIVFKITPSVADTTGEFIFTLDELYQNINNISDIICYINGFHTEANAVSIENMVCHGIPGTKNIKIKFTIGSLNVHIVSVLLKYQNVFVI